MRELYKYLSLLLVSQSILDVLQQNLKRICLAKLYFIPMASIYYTSSKRRNCYANTIYKTWQDIINIKYWLKALKNGMKAVKRFSEFKIDFLKQKYILMYMRAASIKYICMIFASVSNAKSTWTFVKFIKS